MVFVAGQKLTAALLNAAFSVLTPTTIQVTGMSPTADTQDTDGTTTSTSFTATLTGGTACGLAFTAPPSGKVKISSTITLWNSGSSFAVSTIRVRAGSSIGSGADVLAASDDRAMSTFGTNADPKCITYLLTGLTSGNSYNVQQLFRTVAGTSTFKRKHLIVEPTL